MTVRPMTHAEIIARLDAMPESAHGHALHALGHRLRTLPSEPDDALMRQSFDEMVRHLAEWRRLAGWAPATYECPRWARPEDALDVLGMLAREMREAMRVSMKRAGREAAG